MKVFRVLAVVLAGLFVFVSCDLFLETESQSVQECLDNLSDELNKSSRSLSALKDLTHPDASNYDNATLASWSTAFPTDVTDYDFTVSSNSGDEYTVTHGSSGVFSSPLVFTMKKDDDDTHEDYWKILSYSENGSVFFQVK